MLFRQPLYFAALISVISCVRARFSDFRGEDLHATRTQLLAGPSLASKHCGTCHLPPLPESMSQDNAAFVLSYMGLFLGIDASHNLDAYEHAQFKQRFELLKKSAAIPKSPQISETDWKSLRAYYLALARYLFVSHESADQPAIQPIPFADQGVTMLKVLKDSRIAVGGGVKNTFQILHTDLSVNFTATFDSPPVHLEERDGGYYVLTLGSLLGSLSDENHAAIYFIDAQHKTTRKIISNLARSGHFACADTNSDGKTDFIVAAFGAVTGGGVLLFESTRSGYEKKILTNHSSIVRLALLHAQAKKIDLIALAGGAREALLQLTYENGISREKTLAEYPPHLGSVWLEVADLDVDGTKEILVLSGDNADSGPYNEIKPDQGLRIYNFIGTEIKQRHFESAPGALTMALIPAKTGFDIAIARFYAATDTKQDITVLTRGKDLTFSRHHLTLESRPTVLVPISSAGDRRLLIGAGNLPMMAKVDGKVVRRDFSGPVLFTTPLKFAKN